MTFKIQDYDNMHREYTFQDDGKVLVKSSQDLEGHLAYTKRLRDTENQTGKSGDFQHYASIPMVIVEEMMKKGINLLSGDKDQLKAAQREIELNYPHLKVTNKKGW
jgi:hypothetical protein